MPKPGRANPPVGAPKPPLLAPVVPAVPGRFIPGKGFVTGLAPPLLNGLIRLPFGLTVVAGFFVSSSALYLASSLSFNCYSSFKTPGVFAGNFFAGGSTGLSGRLSSVIF